ncbi:MAG: YtxH domain-containing protein [Edaphocola sp.]
MKFSKFNIGLLSGVLLGVLFAPGAGSDTRKKIKSAAGGIKNKIDALLDKSDDELEDLANLLADEKGQSRT